MFFIRLIRSGNSVSEIIIAAFCFVLAALSAIILHECAHGYVALVAGDTTAKDSGRLSLNPRRHFDLIGLLMFLAVGFGWARPVPINSANFKHPKRDRIFVSIAGIVTNLVISGIMLLILFLCGKYIYLISAADSDFVIVLKMFVSYFLLFNIQINMMLALFNFLPVFPLDGFRLINEFLPYGNKYSQFMYRYGAYVLLGLILIGYIGDLVGAPFLNIFGLFSNLILRLINLTVAGGLA